MRILIAEDDIISRKMLGRALVRMGHEVISAEDGVEAERILQKEQLSLVIADWEMPNMDGVELVRRIRASEEERYVYVILLTSRTGKEDMVSGLKSGADDYITKPFDSDELMVRIRAGERIIRLQEELAERNVQLEEMALVDGLTSVANRRAFDTEFKKLRFHSTRFKRPFSLLMLDIDHFKLYNDNLGHEAGDEALRSVAQTLVENVRTSDTVFRYGGEEFVVLLPETALEGANLVANKLCHTIEISGISHPGNPPYGVVTVSAGVGSFDPSEAGSDQAVLGQADQALYRAKANGRNRVETQLDLSNSAAR